MPPFMAMHIVCFHLPIHEAPCCQSAQELETPDHSPSFMCERSLLRRSGSGPTAIARAFLVEEGGERHGEQPRRRRETRLRLTHAVVVDPHGQLVSGHPKEGERKYLEEKEQRRLCCFQTRRKATVHTWIARRTGERAKRNSSTTPGNLIWHPSGQASKQAGKQAMN